MSFAQKSVVRCVDFLNKGKNVISSSLEGDIMIHEILTGNTIVHEWILGSKLPIEGNTCYCVKALKDDHKFISTHEDFLVREFDFNLEEKTMTQSFQYEGHTNTVRNIGLGSDQSWFVTCCEDQSLWIWNRNDKNSVYLLAGHTDFAVCGEWISKDTVVSTSWD